MRRQIHKSKHLRVCWHRHRGWSSDQHPTVRARFLTNELLSYWLSHIPCSGRDVSIGPVQRACCWAALRRSPKNRCDLSPFSRACRALERRKTTACRRARRPRFYRASGSCCRSWESENGTFFRDSGRLKPLVRRVDNRWRFVVCYRCVGCVLVPIGRYSPHTYLSTRYIYQTCIPVVQQWLFIDGFKIGCWNFLY